MLYAVFFTNYIFAIKVETQVIWLKYFNSSVIPINLKNLLQKWKISEKEIKNLDLFNIFSIVQMLDIHWITPIFTEMYWLILFLSLYCNGDKIVTDCDNILLLNLLFVTYASHLISYKKYDNVTIRTSEG